MFTEASGSESGEAACFLNGNWCSYPWHEHWKQESAMRDLSFLEMVLVNLALYLRGSQWGNKKNVCIDMDALVTVLNKQTSKPN